MFRIGEFSRLSRVSVRMLRHYAKLGLLSPVYTDSLTDYRYYSADQLPRLNRILALRDLDFSLNQIGGMLDEEMPSEQLLELLQLKRTEIEQKVQAENFRLGRLEAHIRLVRRAERDGSYDVILRDIDSQWVAAQREVASDGYRIQSMFEEVEIYVAQFERARAQRAPFTTYYDEDYRERSIDAEVAVPLEYPVPGNQQIHIREMPQLTGVACLVHTGGYSSISQAYNALLGWIEANDYRISGPLREVYLRFGAAPLALTLPAAYLTSEANQYVTELQVPVGKR